VGPLSYTTKKVLTHAKAGRASHQIGVEGKRTRQLTGKGKNQPHSSLSAEDDFTPQTRGGALGCRLAKCSKGVYIYQVILVLMEIVFLSKSMLACALSFLSVEVEKRRLNSNHTTIRFQTLENSHQNQQKLCS
jgi:hypothetical protein